MKILVVYTHPNPDSFNHAILEHLVESLKEENKEFDVVDLYGTNFDPILKVDDFIQFREGIPPDVTDHQKRITNATNIIFIHPTWWGGFPAMLKGYLDRVFSLGFAYRMGETQPEGLLLDKKVIFIRTTALPEVAYRVSGVEDLIRTLLTYKFVTVCGVKDLEHHVFYEVPSVSDQVRKQYLEEVRNVGKQL